MNPASASPALVPSAAMPSYRWTILAAATLTQACACFLVQGLGVLGPLIQRDLALTATQVGLLMSAAQLAPLAGLLIAGMLLDRWGERPVVVLGTGMVSLALLGASLSSSYPHLLLWLLAVGAGYSAVQPGGSQSVARWFARSQRGLAMGIRQAGLPLGGAAAAVSIPAVVAVAGWRSALLAGSLIALTGALVFLGVYRSPPGSAHDPAHDPAPQPRPPPTPWRHALRERVQWLGRSEVRCVLGSGVALVSTQVGILLFIVADAHERLGLPIADCAQLLALMLAAGVGGRIALAAWSDRCARGRYYPIWVSLLAVCAGLGIWVCAAGASMGLRIALSLGLGFFGFGWYGPWVTLVAELSPNGRTGSSLGLVMAANQIAIVLVPPLLGVLKDWSGQFTAGWACLIALLLCTAILTRQRINLPLKGHTP
jgi:MFS family permease